MKVLYLVIARTEPYLLYTYRSSYMKIIISPAKGMDVNTDTMEWKKRPVFLEDTRKLCQAIQNLSYQEAKTLWKCNDTIATLNYERFQAMDLETSLTPAILAYHGLSFQHMAPMVFTNHAFKYIESNLRILSGFYGILAPFDGIVPYRLEMQARLSVDEKRNLYAYWGDRIYRELIQEDSVIINLASKEYSQVVEKYVSGKVQFITCIFGELIGEKIVQKSTLAKMARGEMVRFMAEKQITKVEQIKEFDRLGFLYEEKYSSDTELVFIKQKDILPDYL